MGLDIRCPAPAWTAGEDDTEPVCGEAQHPTWYMNYHGFNALRIELWKAAGYKLVDATASWSRSAAPVPDIWQKDLPLAVYQGEWDRYPEDPLVVLVAHSDCDGYIKPDVAPHLAARLRELAPAMPEQLRPYADHLASLLDHCAEHRHIALFT